MNLESGGDPAWECLNNQQNWLMTMLSQCRDEHITEGLLMLIIWEENVLKNCEDCIHNTTLDYFYVGNVAFLYTGKFTVLILKKVYFSVTGKKNKKTEIDSPIQRKNCPMSPHQTGYTAG